MSTSLARKTTANKRQPWDKAGVIVGISRLGVDVHVRIM